MKSFLFALVALTLTACADPLPPQAQWLAGRWEWTGSCCGFTGQPLLPSAGFSMRVDLHHNGEAEVHEVSGDIVYDGRTRFDVDINLLGDTLIRFDRPLIFGRSQFEIRQFVADHVTLIDDPNQCADCPSRHGFARVP